MADYTLENGSYEVLRERLNEGLEALRTTLQQLNAARQETFGSVKQKLIGTERVNTDHNCVARDMVAIGNRMLFGFNVHLGLKANVEVSDVFSIYEYKDHVFHRKELHMLDDSQFEDDFSKLYKYYKDTSFYKFVRKGPFIYFVFNIAREGTDLKAFKWQVTGEGLQYIDNRSDHEVSFPAQHDLKWKKTNRDDHRQGKHPHVSIADRLFVETINGDLTIKVEDNTESGRGIFREEVDNKDQTLDDAEIFYAVYGSLVLLKIRPYQENDFRYIVFNEKLREARVIPAIEDSCIFLPDDQGIIFPNGYYLQSGDYKTYEGNRTSLKYEKQISSPNGEDFLYVYFHPESGAYQLLSFNIIQRQVATPINCHGYALFENGEMAFFAGDDIPKKHHAVQLWQSPYTGANYTTESNNSSYLFKIGNRDIVRAMAECQEIITIAAKGEEYEGIYNDLVEQSTDIIDSYHWLSHAEAFDAKAPLMKIREAANAAIDEFEKVKRLRDETTQRTRKTFEMARELMAAASRESKHSIDGFVERLAGFRRLMGETQALKSLKYAKADEIDEVLEQLKKSSESYAMSCVRFLLREDSLKPYADRINALPAKLGSLSKVVEIREMEKEINTIAGELEMLIEMVSNLQIEDATQSTAIIDRISSLFSQVNRQRSDVRKRLKSVSGDEARAEFAVQSKLIEQSLTNFLDLSDTPEKCEEYMTRLLVQVEELESRFGEFEEFLLKLTESRDAVLDAFEAKKNIILESRNRRKDAIYQSATRILQSMENRVMKMSEAADIEAYFTADIMSQKLQQQISELLALNDSVKADELTSNVKSLRDEALRQLKDRQELYVNGADVISFGKFRFNVNRQSLELSIIPRNESLFFHIGGTNFYQRVDHPALNGNPALWDQLLVSENREVYRGEFLAFSIFRELLRENTLAVYQGLEPDKKRAFVQQRMSARYNEGYSKGIHDEDAMKILESLISFQTSDSLLMYPSSVRARAVRFWLNNFPADRREAAEKRMRGIGLIYSVFGKSAVFEEAASDVQQEMISTGIDSSEAGDMAGYLVRELSGNTTFILSMEAASLAADFTEMIASRKARTVFKESLAKAGKNLPDRYAMVYSWLRASLPEDAAEFMEEAALAVLDTTIFRTAQTPMSQTLEGLQGSHPLISDDGKLAVRFNSLFRKMNRYEREHVPVFEEFQQQKQQAMHDFTSEIQLDSFKPRVMSAFVRNRLINETYLPLIGANLAKQIGEAGDRKRTDLMGLLLLVSPPGYGKTTLMEYLANRLGLIFMKINGPAIGHEVTSLDPAEAPGATSRQEVEKLNLSFEMGDNVMIYLDDIQHLNPEFLQKFISLCDAQRKIEGVWNGRTKTYDFRGKKVCVVMAGNPYTESGEKFRIPDMLANRADIYNLGDIIGGSDEAFNLSYLENCITSNPSLQVLAGRNQSDIYTLISSAAQGSKVPVGELEGNMSQDEAMDCINVFGKLLKIRDVIRNVNSLYVSSAAQADEFRTEPPFKLQGSYRDMNKIAEKVFPVMNDDEVATLIRTHYENEAQSLTRDAEANLLKFREMNGWLSKEDKARWAFIKQEFMKLQKRRGFGENVIAASIDSLRETLEKSTQGSGD